MKHAPFFLDLQDLNNDASVDACSDLEVARFFKQQLKIVEMSVKQWRKYVTEDQEKILRKYDIVLTDWRTFRGSYKYHFDKTIKNVDKGIKIMDKGFKAFDKGMKEFDSGFKGLGEMGKKDLSVLTGSKKTKKDSFSFLTGSTKERNIKKMLGLGKK